MTEEISKLELINKWLDILYNDICTINNIDEDIKTYILKAEQLIDDEIAEREV